MPFAMNYGMYCLRNYFSGFLDCFLFFVFESEDRETTRTLQEAVEGVDFLVCLPAIPSDPHPVLQRDGN